MTLANCLKLLKHFEDVKDDASLKASVREQARLNAESMREHLAKNRGYTPQPEFKLVSGAKAKKSA